MLSVNILKSNVHVGDTVKIHTEVIEGNRKRVQIFEGIIIALSGRAENKMMTVRRVSAGGIGVERKWPINARTIVKVEVRKKAKKVRRSKLYYLRNLVGKAAIRV